jgi:hypothetical protein
MCKISANELSSLIHSLINVAERLVHENGCTQKEHCTIVNDSRTRLYQLREEILDILNKEERHD